MDVDPRNRVLKMKRIFLGLLVISSIPLASAAENACVQYISKPVQGKDFNYYYQKAQNLKVEPKDEFETTVQYKERLDKAFQSLNVPSEFLIEIPIDRKWIKFDADTRLLTFNQGVINSDRVTYGSKFKSLAFANIYSDYAYDVQISRDVKQTGKYIAQNAFGANFEVSRQEVTYKFIFDQPKQRPSLYSYTAPLGAFNVDKNGLTIDKIKALKAGSKAYALISLKPPYAAMTISSPELVTTAGRVASTTINKALFADLKCYVITDEKNTGIIASFLDTKLGDDLIRREQNRSMMGVLD